MASILADILQKYNEIIQSASRSFGIGLSQNAVGKLAIDISGEGATPSAILAKAKEILDTIHNSGQFVHSGLVFKGDHGGYDVYFRLSDDQTTGFDIVEGQRGVYVSLKPGAPKV